MNSKGPSGSHQLTSLQGSSGPYHMTSLALFTSLGCIGNFSCGKKKPCRQDYFLLKCALPAMGVSGLSSVTIHKENGRKQNAVCSAASAQFTMALSARATLISSLMWVLHWKAGSLFIALFAHQIAHLWKPGPSDGGIDQQCLTKCNITSFPKCAEEDSVVTLKQEFPERASLLACSVFYE